MTTKPRIKERIVKAYAIYHTKKKDLAEKIYETKKEAQQDIISICFHQKVGVQAVKIALANYKIIPITIHYQLPTESKKKK